VTGGEVVLERGDAGVSGGYAAAQDSVAPDPDALATLQFGLTYEQAVLEWFDQLPTTLTNLE
jgi:hypothetical protein